MKLLTICIPCHNSIETMHKSISSCLLMKEEIEVLIIDNQSQDETYEVAKEYEKEYPETIKVVKNDSQDYSISFVLQHCHGLYFKILSSGDYLDQPSLVSVVETLRDFMRIQANLDLLINTEHILLKQIDKFSVGELKINGVIWDCETEDGSIIEKGKLVQIISIKGNKLIVKEVKSND